MGEKKVNRVLGPEKGPSPFPVPPCRGLVGTHASRAAGPCSDSSAQVTHPDVLLMGLHMYCAHGPSNNGAAWFG